MTDFKALYDRTVVAQAAVQDVLNQIDAATQDGSEEGTEALTALEAQLDAAIARRDEAQALYDKVVNAHQTNSVAKQFVPVSETPAEPEEDDADGRMTRSDFQNLNPAARVDFLKAGGKVVDA